MSSTARIAICGQAPGTRVHASGRPFTDPSGDRLRDWMGSARMFSTTPPGSRSCRWASAFQASTPRAAICRRVECRGQWHDRVFEAMPQLRLKIVIGAYAQAYHLGRYRRGSVRGDGCRVARDPRRDERRGVLRRSACRILPGATTPGFAPIRGLNATACRFSSARSPLLT
ncbi:MAG: hypothetical protein HPM95_03175 [Alphaproteobacteria bacterium]|nr:hypothetical protein [Alphaproteobacteria bacterium]